MANKYEWTSRVGVAWRLGDSEAWAKLKAAGVDLEEIDSLFYQPDQKHYYISFGDWVETPKDEREERARQALGAETVFGDETEAWPNPEWGYVHLARKHLTPLRRIVLSVLDGKH